ncbi:MAG: O-antigen ligase family protein [Desulfofustis sp.]|nr:O-antigen ligase family protein [Desulfofustis sp.]
MDAAEQTSAPASPNKHQPQRIEEIATIFVCLGCFFTPLSTSLLGLFSLLAALCWLATGKFLHLARDCRNHPALFFSLLLFGFMCLAVSYSPADLSQALDTLKKYRELLFLPIMVSLLSVSSQARERAELSFLAGCIVLMLLSYAMALEIIPHLRYGHSIVFHITHSFFMSILAFWSLHLAFTRGRRRPVWLFIFFAATVNLFYIAPGRTGMFVFVFLMVLFCWQRLSLLKAFVGFLLLCLATIAFYVTSDNFSGRIGEVINEIQTYEPGQSRTSIGQRFDWWMVSGSLIAEKPIFGHGTGAFLAAQQQSSRHASIKLTDNPHNEFLFLTVQFGLVGLALFIAVCFCQLREGSFLPMEKRFLLQGVVGALLAGSLMNSLLFDSQQGHFYLFMSAALLAGSPPNNRLDEHQSDLAAVGDGDHRVAAGTSC